MKINTSSPHTTQTQPEAALREALETLLKHYAPYALECDMWVLGGNTQTDSVLRNARNALMVIQTGTPKPISNLVRFIESHDGCLVESYDGPGARTIKVSSDIRQDDGTIERQTETIPATLKAVKDWLGY